MTKYTWSIAGKDDKIFKEGFTVSNKKSSKPRFKLGTQKKASKVHKVHKI